MLDFISGIHHITGVLLYWIQMCLRRPFSNGKRLLLILIFCFLQFMDWIRKLQILYLLNAVHTLMMNKLLIILNNSNKSGTNLFNDREDAPLATPLLPTVP